MADGRDRRVRENIADRLTTVELLKNHISYLEWQVKESSELPTDVIID
jgi:hypothetical protein